MTGVAAPPADAAPRKAPWQPQQPQQPGEQQRQHLILAQRPQPGPCAAWPPPPPVQHEDEGSVSPPLLRVVTEEEEEEEDGGGGRQHWQAPERRPQQPPETQQPQPLPPQQQQSPPPQQQQQQSRRPPAEAESERRQRPRRQTSAGRPPPAMLMGDNNNRAPSGAQSPLSAIGTIDARRTTSSRSAGRRQSSREPVDRTPLPPRDGPVKRWPWVTMSRRRTNSSSKGEGKKKRLNIKVECPDEEEAVYASESDDDSSIGDYSDHLYNDRSPVKSYIWNHRGLIFIGCIGIIIVAAGISVMMTQNKGQLNQLTRGLMVSGIILLCGLFADLTVVGLMRFLTLSLRCFSEPIRKYQITQATYYLSGAVLSLTLFLWGIYAIITLFIFDQANFATTNETAAGDVNFYFAYRLIGIFSMLCVSRSITTVLRMYLAQDFGTRSYQSRVKESLENEFFLTLLWGRVDPIFYALYQQRQQFQMVEDENSSSGDPELWQRMMSYINFHHVNGISPATDKHAAVKPGVKTDTGAIGRAFANKLFRKMYGLVEARRAVRAVMKMNNRRKNSASQSHIKHTGSMDGDGDGHNAGSDNTADSSKIVRRGSDGDLARLNRMSRSTRMPDIIDQAHGMNAAKSAQLLFSSVDAPTAAAQPAPENLLDTPEGERAAIAAVIRTANEMPGTIPPAARMRQAAMAIRFATSVGGSLPTDPNDSVGSTSRMHRPGSAFRHLFTKAKHGSHHDGNTVRNRHRNPAHPYLKGSSQETSNENLSINGSFSQSMNGHEHRRIYKEELIDVLRQICGEKIFDYDKVYDGLLDPKGTGYLSSTRFRRIVEHMFRDRYSLSLTLQDSQVVIKSIDTMLMAILTVLILLIGLSMFSSDSVQLIASLATAVLAWSFVFGNSVRVTYENLIFLFAIHPYDVGDRIELAGDRFEVLRIRLLTTDLLRSDGAFIRFENSKIPSSGRLFNFSTSQNHGNAFKVIVPADLVTEALVSSLRKDLNEFQRYKSNTFQSFTLTARDLMHPLQTGSDLPMLDGIRAPVFCSMTIWVAFNFTHKSPGDTFERQSEFVVFLCEMLSRHGITRPIIKGADGKQLNGKEHEPTTPNKPKEA